MDDRKTDPDPLRSALIAALNDIKPELEDVESQHQMVSDGLLDSFDVILVVDSLEDSLGIKIPGSQIVPESFESLDAIVALARNNGAGAQA